MCGYKGQVYGTKFPNIFFRIMFLEIVSFVLYLTLSPLGTAGGLHQILTFTPLLYITIFFVKCYIFLNIF